MCDASGDKKIRVSAFPDRKFFGIFSLFVYGIPATRFLTGLPTLDHLDEAGLDVKPVHNRVAGMRETKSEKISSIVKIHVKIVFRKTTEKYQYLRK